MKINIFLIICLSFLLEWDVSDGSIRENQNTHFVFTNIFSPKIEISVSLDADIHVVWSWVRETSGYLIPNNIYDVGYEYRVKFFAIFKRTGCGIDYTNQYCHVPLTRPFRLDYASNKPVSIELHASRPLCSVQTSQSYVTLTSLLVEILSDVI